MSEFLRILGKFRLKLSQKQQSVIQKLYRVKYVATPNVITIQSLLDMER